MIIAPPRLGEQSFRGHEEPVMRAFTIQTTKRCEFIDITERVRESLQHSGIRNGLGMIFVMHTTAGLTINDHLDPAVAEDILLALERAVPYNQPGFKHKSGDSDAHTKASMVGSSVTVVVEDGQLALGRWQGIFLCEFDGPRPRSIKLSWMSVAQADQPPTGML
jgi:secondary thiamine-phosphate synthase enzyme